MTAHRDIEVLRALGRCTFLPGHPHKRFVRQVNQIADHDPAKITWRQWAYVRRLAWTYRRQLPPDFPPYRKPDDPPPRPPKPPKRDRAKPPPVLTDLDSPQMVLL